MGAKVSYVSQNRFAYLIGISQPSVNRAAAAGRLIDAGKGINILNPTNIAFAEMHAEKRAAKGLPPSPWTLGERQPTGPTPRRPGVKKAKSPKPAKAKPKPKPPAKAKPPEPTPIPTPLKAAADAEADTSGPITGGGSVGAGPENVKRGRELHELQKDAKNIEIETKATKLAQEKLKLEASRKELISVSMVSTAIGRLGGLLEDHLRTFGERNAGAIVAAVQGGKTEGAVADLLDGEISKGVNAFKRAAVRELKTLQSQPGGR